MDNTSNTPEALLSRGKIKELREKKAKEREKEIKKLNESFTRIFSSGDGKVLGKWLIEQCGFLESNVVITSSGKISTEATLYNEGRRNLYLELRQHLSSDVLIKLEINEYK